MIAVAGGFAWAGMAALSLAMDRHHAQATGRSEPTRMRRTGLRTAGAFMLIASLGSSVLTYGWGVGTAAWCGWLTAGALPVALLLTYAPRAVPGLLALAILGAAVGVAWPHLHADVLETWNWRI